MRQFANFIKITPSFRVSSVTGSMVVMKSGFSEDSFITHNDIEPEQDQSRKSAGLLYNTKVKAVVDKLTAAQKNIYANNVPVVLTLFNSVTSEKLIVGDPDSPAVISFIPGIEYDQLSIEHSSKTAVL